MFRRRFGYSFLAFSTLHVLKSSAGCFECVVAMRIVGMKFACFLMVLCAGTLDAAPVVKGACTEKTCNQKELELEKLMKRFKELQKVSSRAELTQWINQYVAVTAVLVRTFGQGFKNKFSEQQCQTLYDMWPAFISKTVYTFLDRVKRGNVSLRWDIPKTQLLCNFTDKQATVKAYVGVDPKKKFRILDIRIDGMGIVDLLKSTISQFTENKQESEKNGAIIEGVRNACNDCVAAA